VTIRIGKKRYYLVEDLVKILPINALTIRGYLRKGRIKGRKMGKLWYVSKENLEAFLEGDKAEGTIQLTDEMAKNIKQALEDIKEEPKGE
jgi:predicted site-specific integrase-resolvase